MLSAVFVRRSLKAKVHAHLGMILLAGSCMSMYVLCRLLHLRAMTSTLTLLAFSRGAERHSPTAVTLAKRVEPLTAGVLACWQNCCWVKGLLSCNCVRAPCRVVAAVRWGRRGLGAHVT